MLKRRDFLRIGTLAIPALQGMKAIGRESLSKPLIISTWDFGKAANAEAWKVLSGNRPVIDAVEAGVMVTESDPSNNSVGYGGLPDRDGIVTLDACIMDGQDLSCGSVAGLENIMHPISVAKLVMQKTPHVMLVGQGALDFAMSEGFKKADLLTDEARTAWKEWLKNSKYIPNGNIINGRQAIDKLPGGANNHDTIGLLAMDKNNRIAGACTTSGMAFKMHGRVGDSPIIGAALYVDDEVGGATSTGVGEEVIRICGSHLVVELMRQGISPENACKRAVERIVKRNPERAKTLQVGFLAMNKRGEYGAYSIQQGFSFAVKHAGADTIHKAKYLLK